MTSRLPDGDLTRRLSPLVLSEIMCFTMAGLIGSLDPLLLPLVFREVSSFWRAVADATPELWVNLCVGRTQFVFKNVQVIDDWLGRTGQNRTLNISIFAPPMPHDNILVRQVLATLTRSSSRWSFLTLDIQSCYLSSVLSAPLPSLRMLTLFLRDQPCCSISHSSAPLLQQLDLIQLQSFTLRVDQFHLPWDLIRHLYMCTDTGTLGFIWHILARCTQLLSLTVVAINNSAIPRIPFTRQRPLRSNLQQLTIYANTRSRAIGYFLDGLLLPNIHGLSIFCVNAQSDPDIWPKEAILNLRDRSVAPLSEVWIIGKPMSEEDIVDFVDRLPTLERLTAQNGTANLVTPAVIERLPRDALAIQQRRLAYSAELAQAVRDGRRMMNHL